MNTVRLNIKAIDSDLLDDLASQIGRIAVEAFKQPEVRQQYETACKEMRKYDNSREEATGHRCDGGDW